jgi:Glycosyl transferase family 90
VGCTLNFHEALLSPEDTDGGLIFVAKSWVLLAVLESAFAQGLAFSGSFLFEIGDNGGLESVSFCSNNTSACLILDFDFLRSAGYQEARDACARDPVAWIDRGDKVFWRGASTGRRLVEPPAEGERDDLSWLQRLRLCIAAKDPAVIDRCDIGLSRIVQIAEPHLRDNILKAGLVKGFAPRERFVKQKFVVDIDGNSNAWAGLFLALYGGSCVLKVGSFGGYRQWYYDLLQPWRNYVPIQKDLGDFQEKVDWVRRNDREAEQIAKRGQELARRITLENAIEVSSRNLMTWLTRKYVVADAAV